MEIKIFLRLKDGDLEELKSTIQKLEKDLIDSYAELEIKKTNNFFIAGLLDDYSIIAIGENGK